IQHFEDVLFEEGTAYRDLMDVESAAKYWLVNMAALNNDAYTTGSTYLYKDRDPEGGVAKLYWGPLWDFDFAWDIRNITDGFYFGDEWVKALFHDIGEGGFVRELHKQWPALKRLAEKLVEDGGIIDQYYKETKASAEKDHEIWHPDADFNYYGEVDELKCWIRDRIAWVEENFDRLDHASHKVTFVADGKTYRTSFRTEEEFVEPDEDYPEIEGYTFRGWLDADGKLIESKLPVTGDLTLTAKYVPDSELTHAKDVIFQRTADVVQYDPFMKPYTIRYTVLPADAEDKIVKWSSSDETVAKVDKAGVVTILGPGEVTIRAGLRLGNSGDFTLVITEEEALPVPSSIRTDREEIQMEVGEQAAIGVISDPSPARINDFRYEPDDPLVVSVNRQGVLTAKKAGKTVVHVKTETRDESGKKTLLTTSVTVVVTGEPAPSKEPSKETEKESSPSEESRTPESPRRRPLRLRKQPPRRKRLSRKRRAAAFRGSGSLS
ncbi:MAG: Ig-like domain-containing protein, partial [Lachnospiraceae bacterium]|nr:Ig-like domain-containing protein [Lachnospiraceae bacterium]